MSRAFQVFLLIVLLFGALWAYRFRSRDLRAWLEFGEPPPPEAEELIGLRSPVDRVLTSRTGARLPAFFVHRAAAPPEALIESSPEGFLDPPPAPEPQEQAGERAAELARGPDEPEREPVVIRILPRERSTRREAAAPRGEPVGRSAETKQADGSPAVKTVPATGPRRPSGSIEPGSRSPTLTPGAAQPGAKKRRPASVDGAAALVKSKPAETVPVRKVVSHVVRDKETLASLARRYYKNDTERWREIFSANQHRIEDPDRLPLGLVLEIPGVRGPAPQRGAAGTKAAPVRSGPSRSGGTRSAVQSRPPGGQAEEEGVNG